METKLAPDVVDTLRRRLRALYGPRLRHALLYGSYARGEATEESDLDLFLILDGPVSRRQESERLSDLRMELLTQHGHLLSIVVVSKEKFATEDWPLYRNVRAEGIPLGGFQDTSRLPPAPAPRYAPSGMKENTEKLLKRAHQLLDAARRDFHAEAANLAIDRAYYAAFHAASAALNEVGEAAKSHQGTHDLLYKNYVTTGRLSADVTSILSRLQEKRIDAMYTAEADFSMEEATDALARAGHVVAAIEAVLRS